MITLALALLAFQVATSWNSVTGGFNGLRGIPGLPGLESFGAAYYVATAALLLALALLLDTPALGGLPLEALVFDGLPGGADTLPLGVVRGGVRGGGPALRPSRAEEESRREAGRQS